MPTAPVATSYVLPVLALPVTLAFIGVGVLLIRRGRRPAGWTIASAGVLLPVLSVMLQQMLWVRPR
jgi:hypothetical protein